MKRLLCFVILLALAVIFIPWLHPKAEAAPVSPDQARVAKFWIGQSYYEVDGKRYDMDVAPYVKNGRTMMPVRFLAYSLGILESDVKWDEHNQTVSIVRGPYNDNIFMKVGRDSFNLNGYVNLGSKFDVPPEIIPPGRTMIPYRAVAQALGALVFWDEATKCITVETWKEAPPPTPLSVKKVTVYRNALYADVVKTDGAGVRIQTTNPAMIKDVRDGGYTLDAIEWFKLWGVPESSMLYDPVRGGLAVRGGDSKFGMTEDDVRGKYASGYIYFYTGEKYAWNNFFLKTAVNNSSNNNIVLSGKFYSGWPTKNATYLLFGKSGKGEVSTDTTQAWTELD